MYEVEFILRTQVAAENVRDALNLASEYWGVDETKLNQITEINLEKF